MIIDEYKAEAAVRALLEDTRFDYPENLVVSATSVTFSYKGEVCFSDLDQLAEIFKTKKINFTSGKDDSSGYCSSCYTAGEVSTRFEILDHGIELPLKPLPPPRPTVNFQPRAVSYFCDDHITIGFPAKGGRLSMEPLKKRCTLCRKFAKWEFIPNDPVVLE